MAIADQQVLNRKYGSTGAIISNHRSISSSMGISWRNCPSKAVRRTLQQNSSMGRTCVSVNCRTWGAITNVEKSRHSPTRSMNIPKYWRVVPNPHSNRASLHTRHCNKWCNLVHSNCFRLLGNSGMDSVKQWQNNPNTQHWECKTLPTTWWLAISHENILASLANLAVAKPPQLSTYANGPQCPKVSNAIGLVGRAGIKRSANGVRTVSCQSFAIWSQNVGSRRTISFAKWGYRSSSNCLRFRCGGVFIGFMSIENICSCEQIHWSQSTSKDRKLPVWWSDSICVRWKTFSFSVSQSVKTKSVFNFKSPHSFITGSFWFNMPNMQTKYRSQIQFAFNQSIATYGHQFLLLSVGVHTQVVCMYVIHRLPVQLREGLSFLFLSCCACRFFLSPHRVLLFSLFSVFLLTHRGVLSGSYP